MVEEEHHRGGGEAEAERTIGLFGVHVKGEGTLIGPANLTIGLPNFEPKSRPHEVHPVEVPLNHSVGGE